MTGAGDVESRLSSPEFKIPFRRRLGNDWRDLADSVGIPSHRQRTFVRGDEPTEIWNWMEDREQLSRLPDALRMIGRDDLALLTEWTPGIVYVRLDTYPHDHVFRERYEKVITAAKSSAVGVKDVPRGDGRRPDLHFAAYRAEDIVADRGLKDIVQRVLPPGGAGMVHFFLVGTVESRARAAGLVWDWLGDSPWGALLPRRVLDEKDLEMELTQSLRKLVTTRGDRRPITLLDDPWDSNAGGV